MITPKTRGILNLGEIEQDLQTATASVGGLRLRNLAGPASTQAWSATDLDPSQQTVIKMKTALLATAEKLDSRLHNALAGNSTSLFLQSFLILLFAIAEAILLAIFRESPIVGVVGSIVLGALVAGALWRRRAVQDERTWLMLLVGKYELPILTSNDPAGLRLIAEQMAETLKGLVGPATGPVGQSGTGG